MGMFDSLYDEHGNEWQTKAYDCLLGNYSYGDDLPHLGEGVADYQVEVRGSLGSALATVSGNILRALPAPRDTRLPLVGRYGEIKDLGSPQHDGRREMEALFCSDQSDFRASGVGGGGEQLTVGTMRHGDNIRLRVTSSDAPDQGLMLSEQQARGLRDWLSAIYPDRDEATRAGALTSAADDFPAARLPEGQEADDWLRGRANNTDQNS